MRFAETDGFEYDTHRSDAWRYRDYVIRAFNDDKPYDRFVLEQLAGDEIGAEAGRDADRRGLQSPRPGAQERRQPGSGQQPQRGADRDDQRRRRRVPRRDGGLRALPRSQVRSDPAKRLLPHPGVLRADARTTTCSMPRAEEQAAWKAKAEPVRAGDQRLARSHDGASKANSASADARRSIEEAAGTHAARRCPRYSASSNDAEKQSPIHVLAAASTRSKGRPRRHAAARRALARRDRRSCRRTRTTRGPSWRNGSSIPKIR